MTTRFDRLLTVHPLDDSRFGIEPVGRGFLYGGLTMAMALAPAATMVDGGLVPMVLRCNFLTFGEWGPTEVAVERVSASRSFATVRCRLEQAERLVAVADLTFHRPEHGRDLQHATPVLVPPPSALEPVHLMFGSADPVDPFEVRPVRADAVDDIERFHPFWARTREEMPADPAVHAAALAFMSDYRVIHSPFEPGSGDGEGLRSFTLEHTLWFHRPVDASAWMLFDCLPLTESGGRYVSRGTVHDEQGTLLASLVQEGFIRPA
ncbi:MAG TPA: acyl-CoA thioesterase domain-containing protein [Acidimicrobiia bacterium]|nr:acyl-CoA thioesterase domain-containing protein [Acidimicrobiia bacterium]